MNPTWTLLEGDVRKMLRKIPDASVQCVVTSPPYYSLRDYSTEGQIGLESNWKEHLRTLVRVFRQVRRVMRPDATFWLNYGDAYCTKPNGSLGASGLNEGKHSATEYKRAAGRRSKSSATQRGFKHKDLMLLPSRLAIALQEDGWWVRSETVWSKANPMPESCTDRPTCAHEKVFLLTRGPHYTYDQEATREPLQTPEKRTERVVYAGKSVATSTFLPPNPRGRNLWNVWHIPTEPCPEAHFATFPQKLVEPCINAGAPEHGCCSTCGAPWRRIVEASGGILGQSWNDHKDDLRRGNRYHGSGGLKEGGSEPYRRSTLGWEPGCDCPEADPIPCTVLDPFAGSGTTGVVAMRMGRSFIGIELNPDYCRFARERIAASERSMPLREFRAGQLGLFHDGEAS